jgi:hypothetical protein
MQTNPLRRSRGLANTLKTTAKKDTSATGGFDEGLVVA